MVRAALRCIFPVSCYLDASALSLTRFVWLSVWQVTGNDLMEVTAFQRPDGLLAVIVMNRSTYTTDFKLALAHDPAAGAARIPLPAHSISTLLL